MTNLSKENPMRIDALHVNDTVVVDGWNGTCQITAISCAANEVRVAPLGTWVSADRVDHVVRQPVTADVVNPARIVSAVANDNHTVFEIAVYLGVNHSSALLRATLHDMVNDGLLVADDNDTARRFTLPWE